MASAWREAGRTLGRCMKTKWASGAEMDMIGESIYAIESIVAPTALDQHDGV
jgi:hypothetical protein